MPHRLTTDEPVPAAEAKLARSRGIDPMNAGHAVLAVIAGYGVDTVFGIPGTHNLEFYRHVGRLGIRPITTRHEQGAGYAAEAWARRTGLPGVVITTSGPGLLNVLSAAGTAFCESRPMIVLAPGAPRGEEFNDSGVLHETKGQLAAAEAVFAQATRATSAQEAVDAVHGAFALFRTGRPRPVYIEMPLDVLQSRADLATGSLEPRPAPGPTPADADAVDEAARLLSAAQRPLIVAGGGSLAAGDTLRELAERLGAPIATTLNGKGVVPESHPHSLGAEMRLRNVQELAEDADVLLVVGAKIGRQELWGHSISPRGAVIRIDVLASQLDKNLPATVGLVGHAERVTEQLRDALATLVTEPRAPHLDLAKLRTSLVRVSADFAPVEDRLAARIVRMLPEGSIVTGDASQVSYFGMAYRFAPERPSAFLSTPTYATLGYGLPAAIGAKVASPEATVVSVLGDGALMFALQEFQTAVEQGLDLTVVCVDNGGYKEIRENEAARGIAPVAVDLAQPDWAALMDAFGGRGLRVPRAEDLEAVLAEAISAPGVNLVHVPLGLFV
ncbi:MAG: thiamine pyrophosphate-binding protein [Nocardioides sp.]|uniref:thiamine pyrophosphate-binding protein n=1 Tax=Nocardioides sp. TaxID=35761 RepID=UPI0039E40E51